MRPNRVQDRFRCKIRSTVRGIGASPSQLENPRANLPYSLLAGAADLSFLGDFGFFAENSSKLNAPSLLASFALKTLSAFAGSFLEALNSSKLTEPFLSVSNFSYFFAGSFFLAPSWARTGLAPSKAREVATMRVDRNKDFFIFDVWSCIHWDALDQTLRITKSCALVLLSVGLQNIGASPLRKEPFTVCRMEGKHIGVTWDDHLHYGKSKFGVGEIHDE